MGIFDKLMGKKDKPKADFSNVRSGGSSTAPAPASPSASRPAATKRTYTVVSGDSLSKIAQREYGDAGEWRKIYEANKDTIKNPDLIYPGQTFNIP